MVLLVSCHLPARVSTCYHKLVSDMDSKGLKNMFKRDLGGRFSSFKKWVKNLIFNTLMFLLVCAGISAFVAGIVYYKGGFADRVSAEPTVEVQESMTVEQFFNEKVEIYKNSPEFKAQKEKALKDLEAQLHELATLRIQTAFYTRLEQIK